MKVLVNGGLNLSELDGWWAEAYQPDLGWALGDGREHGDGPARDAIAAEALYARLEQEVVPLFYARNEAGLPVAWVARIRESMAQLTPRFSAARTVRDYAERHYLPAASAYRQRAVDHGAATLKRIDGRKILTREGAAIRFGTMTVETHGDHHVVTVEVFLNDVSPDSIRIELFADGLKGGRMVRQEMTRVRAQAPDTGGQVYRGAVASARPMSDFTARILPQDDGGEVLLEAGWILWQK